MGNKLPEVPIHLKIMKRSPKEILQNKQISVCAAQSTVSQKSSEENSDMLQKIEEEIILKLSYLELLDFENKGFDLSQLHTVKELESMKYLLYVNRVKESMLMESINACQEKLQSTVKAETTPSYEQVDIESFSKLHQNTSDFKGMRYNKLKSLNRSKLAKLLRL